MVINHPLIRPYFQDSHDIIYYISRCFNYPWLCWNGWLIESPEAMYGSALGVLGEWLPGEVRKHRTTISHLGKRSISDSKVPWKGGRVHVCSQEGTWKMDWSWSMNSFCCWFDRFLRLILCAGWIVWWFVDVDSIGWIPLRRCLFKNIRLIYDLWLKNHIIIHIIITYLLIIA